MDVAIAERLTKYLDTIESGIKSSSDFVQEQAPLVVQEFLAWHFWEHAIYAILIIIIITILDYVTRILYRTYKDEPVWLVSLAVIVFLLVPLVPNVVECVKVKVAPRIILIEEVANLVKKTKTN